MLNNFDSNGLLLSSERTFIPKVLDINKWLQVEHRTTELLGCIQPSQKSEILRNNVVSYIKGLITNHVPCQVFQFGSVPLKTYLPDGDIDVTVFGIDQTLPEIFIPKILQIIESEKKNEFAKFKVKDVKLVNAEVKIIKCLIENYVVDISFNQLSDLSSLCFFEEVDNLIGHNHIYKRSIILIKAWCYHESRLLGSNCGLFSTYSLKTLVLYIFNLYSKEFAGPLEVLFRFLEFYSKFDWENYCISLSGPMHLSSLDMIAESPRKGCQRQDLLLNEWFLSACMHCYGYVPRSQEDHDKRFISKHINIVDPLRVDNNLGRSISKAGFFRIKNAFDLGASRMLRLLDCTDEFRIAEFDYFFKNTWHRHGNGHWIHVDVYNQLKESNQMFSSSDACAISQTQSSSLDSNPISEAPNKHCNASVSGKESEADHSSSVSDNNMGLSSRSEVVDNTNIKNSSKRQQHDGKMKTSCDLRIEDADKSKTVTNKGLHKEESNCSTIKESSRTIPLSGYLHALMGHPLDKKEHGGENMSQSIKSGYLEAVKGTKSKNKVATRQQEEERQELQQFSMVKKSINVGKDSVNPPAVIIKCDSVMNPAESGKHTSTLGSTSDVNLSSLPPKTTQPEDVRDQSTMSTDILTHESTTSESEASRYLLNQYFHILHGDFNSYWVNLKYGQHCVNAQSEKHSYFPHTTELPMDIQAHNYWNNMKPSGSTSGVALVAPSMPSTFASDSRIAGVNRRISFWLPQSSRGLGTFMPNPLSYHERYYDEEIFGEHQDANNIFETQANLNFNSRGMSYISGDTQPRNFNSNSRNMFFVRGHNHYNRTEKPEGKREAPRQSEEVGEGSSNLRNMFFGRGHNHYNRTEKPAEGKREAPRQSEDVGEGSSNAAKFGKGFLRS